MDLDNANFLLENLIGRMERDGDAKRWKLEGSISSMEMDALQTILETLAAAPIESPSSTATEAIPEKAGVVVDTKEQAEDETPIPESADKVDDQKIKLDTTALSFDSPQILMLLYAWILVRRCQKQRHPEGLRMNFWS